MDIQKDTNHQNIRIFKLKNNLLRVLGGEKNNIIISIENLLVDMYSSLSQTYYWSGIKLLEYVPDPYKSNCTPTPIDTVRKSGEIASYDDLKVRIS